VPPIISAVTTVVLFVIAFVVIYLLGRSFVTRAVERSLQRRDVDATLVSLATSAATVVTVVVAVALAATVAGFGVVLAAFATLGGALALAVGFAARDLIANFVAGVFIIHDEPFEVGDWVEWNGNSGVVRDIQLRVTKLDTFDNQLLTVPNSDLTTSAVVNNVANDQLRLSVDVGIGYDDDIERAREAIIDEGIDMPYPNTELSGAIEVTNVGEGTEATGA
jgi:small conductance mechanosensitive channel